MKFGIIAILILTTVTVSAQSPDSISDSLHVGNKFKRLVDSLTSLRIVNHLRDSLTINAWSEGLRNKIQRRFSSYAIANSVDSLRMLGVPEPAINHITDSLVQQKSALLREVEEKQNGLQRKVTDRYTTWAENLRKKFNLESPGVSPPVTNLPLNTSSLPAVDIPAVPKTDLPTIGPIPSLESQDFASLGVSPELANVGGSMTIPSGPQLGEWQKSLPAMPDLAEEIGKHKNGLKELTSNPSGAAEKALTNVSQVSDATGALNEAEQLKKQSEALRAAEQLRDPSTATEELQQQAVDHFAGKQAEVQSAMSMMTKYKKKYASIGSLSEIPKNDWLPRNGLKDKPFKERFRVGLGLGVKGAGDTLVLDFYPNASYRITGRIEAGLGAIYRVRVKTDPFGFDQRNPVWGASSFVILKTFKSVFLRCEVDGNSFPISGSTDRAPYRDWRWSFLSGVQTNFKISKKRWTGNVQMLYNFDSSLKDGFPEKLVARVGVQYQLK